MDFARSRPQGASGGQPYSTVRNQATRWEGVRSLPVRTARNILGRFEERLSTSSAVDIAVAWATHCPAIEKLRAFCARTGALRIVVGVDGSATDPTTLRDLASFAHLRIGRARWPANGIFHPKYYCFRASSRNIVWIGSANLTCMGFGGNEELVLEAQGSKDSSQWFESLWKSLDADPNKGIEDYARHWTPPRERAGFQYGRRTKARRTRGAAAERLDPSWSWDDYVDNLMARDEQMLAADTNSSVFRETRSWMNTIRVGHPITALRRWHNLKQWQTDVLIGRRPSWGHLGTLRGAGMACGMLTRNTEAGRNGRRDILRHIRSTRKAGEDSVRAGVDALVGMRKLGCRIGPGVATRLLALARPDCYVSLNGASRAGLARCSGLAPAALDKRYGDLLEWLHHSKWYGVARPADSLRGEVWDYRAALVDALVYNGTEV